MSDPFGVSWFPCQPVNVVLRRGEEVRVCMGGWYFDTEDMQNSLKKVGGSGRSDGNSFSYFRKTTKEVESRNKKWDF